jgi:hypothetical protein
MEQESSRGLPSRHRVGQFLDRLEGIYLRILRGFILIFATGLLFYAATLAVSSLIKISRSPSTVTEEVATVAGNDLLPAEGAEMRRPGASAAPNQTNPQHQRFYASFVNRYHALFRQRFESFRQPEDRQLDRNAFDDAYLRSSDRLAAVTTGRSMFEQDRGDLELLLGAMTEAGNAPETQRRLQSYRAARRVRVCRDEQRVRSVVRTGWDSSSMSCPNWYYPPYGCAAERTVEEPYTERVCEMQFPEGTRSHADIFRAYHDRFFQLLADRRQANSERANAERAMISIGNIEGTLSLTQAMWIFGGFLLVMFFFLLIAIERHQRRLAMSLPLPDHPVSEGEPEEAQGEEPNPAAT